MDAPGKFVEHPRSWSCFRLSPRALETSRVHPKLDIRTLSMNHFFRHRFQKPPFSAVHTTKETFSKRSTFETVAKASVFNNLFGRFSVHGTQKPINTLWVFIRKRISVVRALGPVHNTPEQFQSFGYCLFFCHS